MAGVGQHAPCAPRAGPAADTTRHARPAIATAPLRSTRREGHSQQMAAGHQRQPRNASPISGPGPWDISNTARVTGGRGRWTSPMICWYRGSTKMATSVITPARRRHHRQQVPADEDPRARPACAVPAVPARPGAQNGGEPAGTLGSADQVDDAARQSGGGSRKRVGKLSPSSSRCRSRFRRRLTGRAQMLRRPAASPAAAGSAAPPAPGNSGPPGPTSAARP